VSHDIIPDTDAHTEGLDDIEDVLSSFASSCFAAGDKCSLNSVRPTSVFNFTQPVALLQAIDTTLDALYSRPVPVFDLAVPTVAQAFNLRGLLFGHMYSIASWPALADHLAAAFAGNFTGIVDVTMVKVNAQDATKPDSSGRARDVIFVRVSTPFVDAHILTFYSAQT
jgi:hypothetical protein